MKPADSCSSSEKKRRGRQRMADVTADVRVRMPAAVYDRECVAALRAGISVPEAIRRLVDRRASSTA